MDRLIDESGSDHYALVGITTQRRVAEQVSQIQNKGHPLLPTIASTCGYCSRRQLFAPMPPHKGMDEQAALTLMGSHESALEIVRNLGGARKVDVAERLQDAGLM